MKKRSLFLLGRQILQREAVDTSLDCFILIYKGAYDNLFTLFQLVIYIENNCHEFSGWNVPVDSLSLLWLKKVWVTKNSVSASFRVKICLSNTWLAQCYSFKKKYPCLFVFKFGFILPNLLLEYDNCSIYKKTKTFNPNPVWNRNHWILG